MPGPHIESDSLRRRGWWIVTAGWCGFFLLWTLFILGWGQGEVLFAGAVLSAVLATVPAAFLGLLVWKLAGRLPWPGGAGAHFAAVQFVAAHFAGMAVYAISWTLASPVVATLIEGDSLGEMRWEPQTYIWRLFMGVLLYVIVAGLSYAAHTNERLRRQEKVVARAEALAAKANLAAMRSQLQPHFLFNALHSISSLIESDPERAVDAMELLGDMLRYTVRERDDDLVPFAEEWAFVSDYVELQQMRFGALVDVTMEPARNAGAVPVPPFVLQPLVENAFVHGMRGRSSGGVVRVAASTVDGYLTLTVEDNGGPDATDSREGAGSGSGLENLRLRLQSLYGDGAVLSVAPRAGGGTVATISIADTR